MLKSLRVNSLRRRILLTTIGTILFFLLLAGIALDKAFQRIIRSNIAEQLQTLTFSLLASAELDANSQFSIPAQLAQSAITIPKSGLIALIIDHAGKIVWRSPSALGENLPELQPMTAGAKDFQHNKYDASKPFIYRFGSVWGSGDENDRFLTIVILQSKAAYTRQIKDYRETLLQWLGGGAMFILLIQGFVLFRQLRPLKRVVNEIDAIEHGSSDHIQGHYPSELALLTQRINRFIRNERNQLSRYRHSLDDLAHSLKTPLAVVRSLGENPDLKTSDTQQLREQINRMSDIIEYQLKRAASAGKKTLGTNQIPLYPVIEKTLYALEKVYANKQVKHLLHCDFSVVFCGDKDDLYEIIGNIGDNAYKWATNLVRISAKLSHDDLSQWLIITIEDDGNGFTLESAQQITQRGVRTDEQVPGQGIGMAVVKNIVLAYEGTIFTGKSELGGALVRLSFPHPA